MATQSSIDPASRDNLPIAADRHWLGKSMSVSWQGRGVLQTETLYPWLVAKFNVCSVDPKRQNFKVPKRPESHRPKRRNRREFTTVKTHDLQGARRA